MTFRSCAPRAPRPLALLGGGLLACLMAALPAQAQSAQSWGAIASRQGAFGYSFNHRTRDEAERAALAQCNRAAGRAGPCEVRAYFDRSCAALATGSFGEWGAAVEATEAAAVKASVGQCESYLPTEPCKVAVKVCSQG